MGKGMPWEKFDYDAFMDDLRPCSAETRGFWISILAYFWKNGGISSVDGSVEMLCRISSCDEKEVKNSIKELENKNICDVKQNGNGIVTLINRRLKREEKERENTRLRVGKFRNYGPVTQKKRPGNTVDIDIDKEVDKEKEIKRQQPSLKPTEEEKKELASLCTKVNSKYPGFNSFAWIQKHINCNPSAHVHVLKALLENQAKSPWAYADQIISVENGNYNEAESIAKSNEFKKNQIGKILKGVFNGESKSKAD